MFETILVNLLTSKIIPLVVPPLVTLGRKLIREKLPSKLVPVALAVGGGLVGAIGSAMGVDVPDLTEISGEAAVGAWEGALVALAGAGVYDVVKKTRQWLKERKT